MEVIPLWIAEFWKLDIFQNMPYLSPVNMNLENDHG
jgi:hypothetical protein